MHTTQTGLYGKIPAHGDFIDRGLASSFITVWDEWLQHSVSSSQELLAANWLDYYLTSPLWRFVLSPGTVDNNIYAGVLLPSVDSVGRYFPLTLAARLHSSANTFAFLDQQKQWFAQLESIALAALQETLNVDELMQRIDSLTAPQNILTQPLTGGYALNNTGTAITATQAFSTNATTDIYAENALNDTSTVENPVASTASTADAANSENVSNDEYVSSDENATAHHHGPGAECYTQLLQQTIAPQFSSYSLWWSDGSAHVQPTFLLATGLPNAQGYTALLDGHWQQWGWHV